MKECMAMRPDGDKNPPEGAVMNPIAVRVDLNRHGAWEVALPDERERIVCGTLEDARRVGFLCAADRRPCELIVCDAYHRVLHRELVNGHGDSQLGPRSPGKRAGGHSPGNRLW